MASAAGGIVYRTSPVKPPRLRSTKATVTQLRADLLGIVANGNPMSVRQIFYQASVRGLVQKSETGYRKVQEALAHMRRVGGEMPCGWIADSTRWQRRPHTFDSVEDALTETARLYRKALWTNARTYVEVWLEKDALTGVILPVTDLCDVPLMVARGYASISFLNTAAAYIALLAVPAHIYHFGDFDPSGVDAGRAIEATLREYAPHAKIHFERLAVTPRQIAEWSLPTRPTKATDSRAKGFGAISVELDAIPPQDLRDLVQGAIEQHLPRRELDVLLAAEESERSTFKKLIGSLAASGRAS